MHFCSLKSILWSRFGGLLTGLLKIGTNGLWSVCTVVHSWPWIYWLKHLQANTMARHSFWICAYSETCVFRTPWDQLKVSWLSRCPDFPGQFTCKWILWDHYQVSWLWRCPYFQGSWLTGFTVVLFYFGQGPWDYATGCLFCKSVAPRPFSEVSHCIVNCAFAS